MLSFGAVYTLHTASFSSNGRKAVALGVHLDLSPEVLEVNVYQGAGQHPDYLDVNPWGKVPTLVDGALTLWESNAILIYISEAYGNHALWSREAHVRADIARWLFWESSHWQPVLTEVLAQHAGHIMVPTLVGPPTTDPDWDAQRLKPLLRHLEGRLGKHAYVAKMDLSLADFSLVAMTIYFRRLGFPFERYPAFADWYHRVHALPAWQQTNVEPWLP